MKRTFSFLLVVLALGLLPAFAQNLPPTAVYARDYNYGAIQSAQANTYTFNGGACLYTPTGGSVNGQANSFFVFGGYQGATYVDFPVAILDAIPASSEIVTPSSTVSTSATCGFAASPLNSHTTFSLASGTAGLEEAIVSQNQSGPTFDVILDKAWYTAVAGLPGTPSAYSIINAVAGNANVAIVDTTTTPWTFFCYNGTNYTTCASNLTVPTLAVSTGAGGTPTVHTVVGTGTSGIVSVTTGGTAPGATATIFTLTWPAIASGGFQYAPVCTISGLGTTAYAGTNATVAGPPAVDTYTSTATALANTTAYKWSYTCR